MLWCMSFSTIPRVCFLLFHCYVAAVYCWPVIFLCMSPRLVQKLWFFHALILRFAVPAMQFHWPKQRWYKGRFKEAIPIPYDNNHQSLNITGWKVSKLVSLIRYLLNGRWKYLTVWLNPIYYTRLPWHLWSIFYQMENNEQTSSCGMVSRWSTVSFESISLMSYPVKIVVFILFKATHRCVEIAKTH